MDPITSTLIGRTSAIVATIVLALERASLTRLIAMRSKPIGGGLC